MNGMDCLLNDAVNAVQIIRLSISAEMGNETFNVCVKEGLQIMHCISMSTFFCLLKRQYATSK